AGRAGDIVGFIAAAGSDGGAAAPGPGIDPGAPVRHWRMVNPGPAVGPKCPGLASQRAMTAAENAAKMGGGRDAGRDRNGTVAEALDDAGDLAAVDTDIGERTVIERDQLGIGLRAPPPVCPGIFRGYEKTDDRHGRNSQRECCI